MRRTTTILASFLLASLVLASCGTEVCLPDPAEEADPNGYCQSDDDCAESDFCLLEWCDGPCRPMERCFLRIPEGEWCNRSRMCAEGLKCSASDEFDAGECAP